MVSHTEKTIAHLFWKNSLTLKLILLSKNQEELRRRNEETRRETERLRLETEELKQKYQELEVRDHP